MDSGSDEINLFLTAVLGLILLVMAIAALVIYRLLTSDRVVELSQKHPLLEVLRGAILSFGGTFVLAVVIVVAIAIVRIAIGLLIN